MKDVSLTDEEGAYLLSQIEEAYNRSMANTEETTTRKPPHFTLDLSNNELTSVFLKHVSDSMTQCPGIITHIYIANNLIEDGEIVVSNNTRTIDLSGCGIEDSNATKFFSQLQNTDSSIRSIKLSNNNISDLNSIVTYLNSPKGQQVTVDVTNNPIPAETITLLASAEYDSIRPRLKTSAPTPIQIDPAAVNQNLQMQSPNIQQQNVVNSQIAQQQVPSMQQQMNQQAVQGVQQQQMSQQTVPGVQQQQMMGQQAVPSIQQQMSQQTAPGIQQQINQQTVPGVQQQQMGQQSVPSM